MAAHCAAHGPLPSWTNRRFSKRHCPSSKTCIHLCVFCIVCCLATSRANGVEAHEDEYDRLVGNSSDVTEISDWLQQRIRSTNETCRGCHEESFYVQQIFAKFGDEQHHLLAYNGFLTLFRSLGLDEATPGALPTATASQSGTVGGGNPTTTKQHHVVRRETASVHNHTHGVFNTHIENATPASQCSSAAAVIASTFGGTAERVTMTEHDFLHVCPALVYQLAVAHCAGDRHQHVVEDREVVTRLDHRHGVSVEQVTPRHQVWGFATLAVIVISCCGLLGVVIVPILEKAFYNQLLQFFVALAVGSLSGDALLHLLPHALGVHALEEGFVDEHGVQRLRFDFVWKGATVLVGIYGFFIVEQLMQTYVNRKSNRRESKRLQEKLKDLPEEGACGRDESADAAVGSKLCNHNQSGSADNLSILHECENLRSHELKHLGEKPTLNDGGGATERVDDVNTAFLPPSSGKTEHGSDVTSLKTNGHSHGHGHSHKDKQASEGHSHGYGRGHTSGHSHGHSYGHSHGPHHLDHDDEGPHSVSSIAWMVIMGDGMHNLTDGLAIGAAFAAGLPSGLSTAIAVFCHELPHELGDFAMLLKTGMSVRHAMFYNIVSSVLCFFGMLIGVGLGNVPAASMWIFAMMAGVFLYIAFVDMLPEIRVCDTQHGCGHCLQLLGQILGIGIGIIIMVIIAVFENDIKNLVRG